MATEKQALLDDFCSPDFWRVLGSLDRRQKTGFYLAREKRFLRMKMRESAGVSVQTKES